MASLKAAVRRHSPAAGQRHQHRSAPRYRQPRRWRCSEGSEPQSGGRLRRFTAAVTAAAQAAGASAESASSASLGRAPDDSHHAHDFPQQTMDQEVPLIPLRCTLRVEAPNLVFLLVQFQSGPTCFEIAARCRVDTAHGSRLGTDSTAVVHQALKGCGTRVIGDCKGALASSIRAASPGSMIPTGLCLMTAVRSDPSVIPSLLNR